MRRMTLGICIGLVAGLALSAMVRPTMARGQDENAAANRVFEMRTYTAAPGKMDELHARFRDHTMQLFEKHGMKNVIYLSPTDEKKAKTTLVYLISHESLEAAQKSWKDFRADPEWQAAYKASEKNGKLATKADFEFFVPTDYSPIKN